MPCIPRRRPQLVLHGSLTTFRRRCGKDSCHCATGEPHETPAFVYTEEGRSKTLTLRPGEAAEVSAAIAAYESSRDELEAAARAGIAALKARRSGSRP